MLTATHEFHGISVVMMVSVLWHLHQIVCSATNGQKKITE